MIKQAISAERIIEISKDSEDLYNFRRQQGLTGAEMKNVLRSAEIVSSRAEFDKSGKKLTLEVGKKSYSVNLNEVALSFRS